jgi:uncharacterized protein YacL
MLKAIFQKLITSGFLTWLVTHFMYGGAEYADLGVTTVSAQTAELGIPAIVAALFTFFTEKGKLPSIKGIIDLILQKVSFGKVGFLESGPKTSHALLTMLSKVEIEAAELGIDSDVSKVRTAALAKLKQS